MANPAIISSWLAFPVDKVLEFMSSFMSPCILNVLNFILFVILCYY